MSSPLKILYVEDDALVREITCEMLASGSRDVDVVAVATGEQALTAFREQRFDLVMTDVSLPAMSGLDLVRRIHSTDPAMPIIVASGYALDPQHYRWGPHVGAITKPFDSPDLDLLIQKLCPVLEKSAPV
jgi:CheY-like chemotaxis protein